MERRPVLKNRPRALCFDPAACTGCGICELMCALHCEGTGGPAAARLRIRGDALSAEYQIHVCRQCLAPSCYAACPDQGQAIRINPETGITWIDEAACRGCRECMQACPLTPPAVGFNEEKRKAFKCDLCEPETGRPICVSYCPSGALSIKHLQKDRKKQKK